MSRKQRSRKEGRLKGGGMPAATTEVFRWWVAPLVLLGLILAVYVNSLGNEFVSDDIPSILQSRTIGTSKQSMGAGPTLGVIHFVLANIFGRNPFWFRLVNVLFHWGSTVWLFNLLALSMTSGLALAVAAIFAVHPLATEAVVWISGMPYAIYAFYYFLCLFLFVRNKNRTDRIVSFIAYILGILSNALGIVLAPILTYWLLINKQFKARFGEWMTYSLVAVIRLMQMFSLLGVRATSLQTDFYQVETKIYPLEQIPVAVASYLKLIFWPRELTLYHSEMSFSLSAYWTMLGLTVGLLVLIVWAVRRLPLVGFWLGFFVISLLPTLTPWGVSWIVAERYAYFGFVGVIVGVVLLTDRFLLVGLPHWIKLVVLFLVIVSLGTRTVIRTLDWKSQDTLWSATAKYSPSSPQNHNNLGDVYARRGETKKAIAEFETAIKLNPRYGDAFHNLANMYLQIGDFNKAEENYKKALEINPNLWQSYAQLGMIYTNEGKKEEADEAFKKASRLNAIR